MCVCMISYIKCCLDKYKKNITNIPSDNLLTACNLTYFFSVPTQMNIIKLDIHVVH